jgi:hypothetical protein
MFHYTISRVLDSKCQYSRTNCRYLQTQIYLLERLWTQMRFGKTLIIIIIVLILFGAITPFPFNLGILLIAIFLLIFGIKRKGDHQDQDQVNKGRE